MLRHSWASGDKGYFSEEIWKRLCCGSYWFASWQWCESLGTVFFFGGGGRERFLLDVWIVSLHNIFWSKLWLKPWDSYSALHVNSGDELISVWDGHSFSQGDDSLNCLLYHQLIEKLSLLNPSGELKLKIMKEIAKEYQVKWDTTETEMELLKPPEERIVSYSFLSWHAFFFKLLHR